MRRNSLYYDKPNSQSRGKNETKIEKGDNIKHPSGQIHYCIIDEATGEIRQHGYTNDEQAFLAHPIEQGEAKYIMNTYEELDMVIERDEKTNESKNKIDMGKGKMERKEKFRER